MPGVMPRRPQVAGMETPTRARRRKPDTAKVDLEPPRRNCGGQAAHREVGSEGFAEQYRARSRGGDPMTNRSAKRWGKVEPALWRRRRSHPPTAPRCMRAARYGRPVRDPGRPRRVRGWRRGN